MDKDLVAKELFRVEKQNLEHNNRTFKQSQELIVTANSIRNDIHEIKQNQGKHNLIVMGVVLLAGIAIGTQYKAWLPFVSDIVTTVKHTKNIKESVQ